MLSAFRTKWITKNRYTIKIILKLPTNEKVYNLLFEVHKEYNSINDNGAGITMGKISK
jgi:hypothetical protein